MRPWLRAVIAFVVLMAAQMIVGALFLPKLPASPPAGVALSAASTALAASLLTFLAARLACSGWHRFLVLFAAAWGIQANNLVEAGFFPLGLESGVLPRLFVVTLLPALAVCVTLDRVSGPPASAPAGWPPVRTPVAWAVTFSSCVLGYALVYLVAGMLVWPHVRGFYEGHVMPGLPLIMFVQLFRGSFLVGLLALLASRLSLSRAGTAVAGGVTLSLIGGVVPLMAPTPFMPDAIRLAHLVEVGTSNLLFGWLAVLALTRVSSRTAHRTVVPVRPW